MVELNHASYPPKVASSRTGGPGANPSEKAGKPNLTKKNQIEQVLFGSTIETILGLVIQII